MGLELGPATSAIALRIMQFENRAQILIEKPGKHTIL